MKIIIKLSLIFFVCCAVLPAKAVDDLKCKKLMPKTECKKEFKTKKIKTRESLGARAFGGVMRLLVLLSGQPIDAKKIACGQGWK